MQDQYVHLPQKLLTARARWVSLGQRAATHWGDTVGMRRKRRTPADLEPKQASPRRLPRCRTHDLQR